MSKTLNLIDLLLNSGRHLFDIGRTAEALEVLTRLADFRQLPRDIIEETQALLADVHLRQENYTKARRHLTAAIALQPLKAEYHHKMAVAIEEDGRADLKRAEMYYEQAVKAEPDCAAYWADFGAYLFRLGKNEAALKALRRAFKLGIQEADVVDQVVDILRQEEHLDEATSNLRMALFHNHGSEPFRRLWQQHRFFLASAEQEQARRDSADPNQAPVILPFVAREQTGKYIDLGAKTFRLDQPERVNEPRSSPVRLPYPPKG